MVESILLGNRATGARQRRRKSSSYTVELGMDALRNTSILRNTPLEHWRSKRKVTSRDGPMSFGQSMGHLIKRARSQRSAGTLRAGSAETLNDVESYTSDISYMSSFGIITNVGNTVNEERMSLQKRARRYLAVSVSGFLLDCFNGFLSVLACVVFICATYAWEDDYLTAVLTSADLVLTLFFFADFALRMFLADSVCRYLTTTYALIDFCTIMPTIFTYGREAMEQHVNLGSHTIMFVELVGVVKLLRIFRVQRIFIHLDSEISQSIASVILNIMALSLFTAGLMHILESDHLESIGEEPHEYHSMFYLIIVTLSTVGYGDISPVSGGGRAVASFFIIFALFYIPKAVNSVLRLVSMRSAYLTNKYKPTTHTRHVLVCGRVSPVVLRSICQEFFHFDHGAQNLDLVVLCKGQPSSEMEQILNDPRYSISLLYIDGSPFFSKDLFRANAHKAVACIITTDKWAAQADAADSFAILTALSLKRFAKQYGKSDIPVCLQLLKPTNLAHFHVSRKQLNSRSTVMDQVVVVLELKMKMLAKSCHVSGLVALLTTLITSSNISSRGSISFGGEIDSDSPRDALRERDREFAEGSGYEIYRVCLSPAFRGLEFCDLANMAYASDLVTLIGLEISTRYSSPRIMLNPGHFVIPDDDYFTVHAFVIAQDKTSADIFSDVSRPILATSVPIRSKFQSVRTKNMGRVRPDSGILHASPGQDENVYINPGEEEILQQQDGGRERLIALALSKKQVLLEEADGREQQVENGIGTINTDQGDGDGDADAEQLKDIEMTKGTSLRQSISTNNYGEYYLLETEVDLSDVTVHQSLHDDLPDVVDHIVVMGDMANLYPFIQTLRSRMLGSIQAIVLLHPHPPAQVDWRRISHFPEIIFIQGSPLQKTDLIRAGVEYASCAVVLAKSSTGQVGEGTEQENDWNRTRSDSGDKAIHEGSDSRKERLFSDADAIFAHQGIMRINPNIKIITEITNQANVTFLDSEEEARSQWSTGQSESNSIQFRAGRVYAASFLDTLLCQAFFNPQLTTILSLLVIGSDPSHSKRWGAAHKSLGKIYESQLFQIPVPQQFVNSTYGEFFSHACTEHAMVPMGIFRGVWKRGGAHGHDAASASPYVYNPPHEATLHSCDWLFVLSQSPPKRQEARTKVANIASILRKVKEYGHSHNSKSNITKGTIFRKVVSKAQSTHAEDPDLYVSNTNIESKEKSRYAEWEHGSVHSAVSQMRHRLTQTLETMELHVLGQHKQMKQDIQDLKKRVNADQPDKSTGVISKSVSHISQTDNAIKRLPSHSEEPATVFEDAKADKSNIKGPNTTQTVPWVRGIVKMSSDEGGKDSEGSGEDGGGGEKLRGRRGDVDNLGSFLVPTTSKKE